MARETALRNLAFRLRERPPWCCYVTKCPPEGTSKADSVTFADLKRKLVSSRIYVKNPGIECLFDNIYI